MTGTVVRLGLTLSLAASLLSLGCSSNQTPAETPSPLRPPAASAPASPAALIKARGTVKEVAADKKKVTISHGDIPELKMKAMTMPFKVKSEDILVTVKPDQEVDFFIDNSAGEILIVEIKPVTK